MSDADPYAPDDDGPDDRPSVPPADPRHSGANRVAPPDLRTRLHAVPTRAEGVALTPLPYDPRTYQGAVPTRLPYDPRRFQGSTGRELYDEETAKAFCMGAREVPAWFGSWLHQRAEAGHFPPAWAEPLCLSRGRQDLAQYATNLRRTMLEQARRRA